MRQIEWTRRALGRAVASVGVAAALPAAASVQRPFKYAFANSDLGSADPINIRASNDDVICRQVFMSLVSPPYGTGDNDPAKCQPELAERWTASPDNKTWTFFLKRGVLWHRDYGEVTAEDVKFSFDRVRSNNSGSLYAEGYADLVDIEVVDKYTVRFHLTQSNPIFHATHLFPREGAFIVPKRAVEEMGGAAFSRNPVGSGAYEFAAYQPGRQVTLKANPRFHRGPAKLNELHFLYMPETAARTIAFRKGDLDFIDGARAPGWAPDLKRAMPSAKIVVLFPGSTQIMHLDTGRKPFSDLRVRQAVAYGIDHGVFKEAYGELSGPLFGMNAPGTYGALGEADAPAELRYAYNPDRARALLAEAGYGSGLSVNVYISKREDYTTNMLLVQDMLKKVGITLNVSLVDHATYHSDNRKDKNPIVIMSGPNTETAARWNATYFASGSNTTADGRGGSNFSHYGVATPGIDAELNAARAEADGVKQAAMLRDIERHLLRDLPAIPLQCLGWVWVQQPFRLVDAVPTVLLVLTLVFAALRILPGDPAVAVLGDRAPIEQLDAFRHKIGLDQSLPVQYLNFLKQVVTGDFGRSLANDTPVTRLLAENLPFTLQLTGAAMLISLVIGIPVGILSATAHRRLPDHIARLFGLAGYCIPDFFLGALFMLYFGLELDLLPVMGGGEGASAVPTRISAAGSLLRDPVAVICIFVIAALLVLAIFAPIFAAS
eukprot:gene2127-2164_t